MRRIFIIALIFLMGSRGMYAQATSAAANASDAQTLSAAPSVTAVDGDPAWVALQTQLKATGNGAKSTGTQSSSTVQVVQDAVSQSDATTLFAQADLYKDFYTKNPKSKNVPDAKKGEVMALINAEQQGNTDQHARTAALVASLRKDNSLQDNDRYVVAANWDHLPVFPLKDLTDDSYKAVESIERSLLKEFPQLNNAYDALLCLANVMSDDNAKRIAKDLDDKKTPDWIRKEAQALLSRQDLVGKDIKTILVKAVGQNDAFKSVPGKITVVYSWVPWNPYGIAQIKDLAKKLPPDTVFIGVCVDINAIRGIAAFASESMPGQGFVDEKGAGGALATALSLTLPNQIIFADALGVIRTVTLQVNTDQKLQSLLAK